MVGINSDIVPIPKELYKTRVKRHNFLLPIKINEERFFRKECNELLIIRYFLSNVRVPLRLLVTAI